MYTLIFSMGATAPSPPPPLPQFIKGQDLEGIATARSVLTVLQRLALREFSDAEAEAEHELRDLEEVRSMTSGASATCGLLRHVGYWPERAAAGAASDFDASLRVSLRGLRGHLFYDTAVARALSVFPQHSLGADDGPKVQPTAPGPPLEDEDRFTAEAEGISAAPSGTLSAPQSLYDVLRCTRTQMGARELRRKLQLPDNELAIIEARLDVVEALVVCPSVRRALRDSSACLLRCPDTERLAQRFKTTRSAATRASLADALAVYRSAQRLEQVQEQVLHLQQLCGSGAEAQDVSPSVATSIGTLLIQPMAVLLRTLDRFKALVEEVVDAEALARAGGTGDGDLRCFRTGREVQVRTHACDLLTLA